jgi:hypothetical protein
MPRRPGTRPAVDDDAVLRRHAARCDELVDQIGVILGVAAEHVGPECRQGMRVRRFEGYLGSHGVLPVRQTCGERRPGGPRSATPPAAYCRRRSGIEATALRSAGVTGARRSPQARRLRAPARAANTAAGTKSACSHLAASAARQVARTSAVLGGRCCLMDSLVTHAELGDLLTKPIARKARNWPSP